MSAALFFRGTLNEANAYAAGRRDLTVIHDVGSVYPRIWCVVRGRSAWADLYQAQGDLERAQKAMKLARGSFIFSPSTRRAMKRDATRLAFSAVAYALRAQLHLKAGLLT
jgi:hypothetical protein